MSEMLNIQLTSDASQVVSNLKRFPDEMANAITAALDTRNQLAIAHIVSTKLTAAGPRFLNVRTGRLRGSVRASKAKITNTTVTSSIGTNVKYAATHEDGYTGPQNVKAFTRRNRRGDKFSLVNGGAEFNRSVAEKLGLFGKTGRLKARAKKVSSGISFVHAFTRTANFHARHMFRTGLEEQLPFYGDDISAAIVRAWEEKS